LSNWLTLTAFRSMYLLSYFFWFYTFVFAYDFSLSPFYKWLYLFCQCRNYALIYHGVHCSYVSLGQTLMPDGHVDNFLIPCFCRKLFEDNHPSKSRRHYFFSYIGVCNFLLFFHMCLLVILHFLFTWFAVFLALPFNGRKAFCYYQLKCMRALSALHFLVLLAWVKRNILISLTEYVFSWFIKCSVQFFIFIAVLIHVVLSTWLLQLFFPICHLDHWFSFVVDFKFKLFAFIDSFYGPDSDYQRSVRGPLVSIFLIPCFFHLLHTSSA
jgi:hypothetical protein